jgi:uroporphyrinogen III methyltransferase/synthase
MTTGKVYLVGAGPGDPGLLTLRGAELLARADVVVYDRLVSPRLLRHARGQAEQIYVGKQPAAGGMTQEQINALLVERARAGKTVVRLKGGDPLIFGRGGEEALALAAAGVDFEIVPGVTAVSAAAAGAGIPVTHRGLASCLGLVAGHESAERPEDLDWSALAAWPGTLAFYMAVANLETIARRLTDAGLDGGTPAAVVQWAGTASQRVVTATLADIAAKAQHEDVNSPAILLVGTVVSLREQIEWFSRRALFGQRVAVTRSADQAGELVAALEELGAAAVECPTIATEPPADPGALRKAAASLREFSWIVFTSVHAVEALWGALAEAGRDARALAGCKLCCVGAATVRRLEQFGLRCDVQPAEASTAALVEAMAAAADLRDAPVLYPRSDIAPPDLPQALAACGARVTAAEAYRTRTDATGAARLRQLLADGQVDWITFTSPSTVTAALSAVDARALQARPVHLASIGPSTSAALRAAGLQPTVEAAEHTVRGLVEAIVAACHPSEGRS